MKGMKLKVLNKGISLNRGPAGEAGRGSVTGNFERWMNCSMFKIFSTYIC